MGTKQHYRGGQKLTQTVYGTPSLSDYNVREHLIVHRNDNETYGCARCEMLPLKKESRSNELRHSVII